MTAKEFYDKFIELIDSNKTDAIEGYKTNTGFTAFLKEHLRELLKGCNIKSQCEYYRIDITGWQENTVKLEENAPSSFYDFNKEPWRFVIAIEYENSEKWLYEVLKLAYIKSPLRVVIGYLPVGVEREPYIQYTSKAFNALSVEQSANDEFLLIIGNTDCKGDETTFFDFQPYIYDTLAKKFALQRWNSPTLN
jgi:hypothetical protein